jgi:hypothetical protein
MGSRAQRSADSLFRPSAKDLERIDNDVSAIPDIQEQLVANDSDLAVRDRVAHQYQTAGGMVRLKVGLELPASLAGIGLFQPGSEHIGLGRLSTGLGCPHRETDPDFFGLRLAFQTTSGARVDFLGINDPASPTDTHVQFMKLLEATAMGAGAGVLARSVRLLRGLVADLGFIMGIRIAAHVLRQTARTALSTTAYQAYWTGIVETGGMLGKFRLEPPPGRTRADTVSAGRYHLTEEWRRRQAKDSVPFDLYWLPFIDEHKTSLLALTRAWQEHRYLVGRVTFPQCDPASDETQLWAILAAEMGVNPGNWVSDHDNTIRDPTTVFGTARKIAYRKSQVGRDTLADGDYATVFYKGVIDSVLADELKRRRAAKRASGHINGVS